MSHPEYVIARVSAPDVDDLLPLMRAYCDFYAVTPTDTQLLAMTAALIADPEHEGIQLIARDAAGRAVGFATVFWSWSTTDGGRIGVMNDLFVDTAARGTGIADQLIEACRRSAGAHGAGQLTWQTAADNARAQRVYDRVGAHREQWVDYWLATSPHRP
jgi:GNAT superfamily N-acetyltransferase